MDILTTGGPAPVRLSAHAPALSPARARVLEYVQARPDGASIDEVAAAEEHHPNTVRAHLDALVELGLLLRTRTPGPGRGRPAWRYRGNAAHREPDSRVREYAALVGALAAHIEAHSRDPQSEARAAGERWGHDLIAADGPDAPDGIAADPAASRSRPAAAHRRVVRMLEDLSFGPRPDRSGSAVVLTTCPILDAAVAHPQVVCAVHEGMVAGALTTLGAPSEGVALHPFALPDGCLLTLTATPQAGAGGVHG